jgi:amino acid adenylation domain-containing protein
MNWDDWYRQYGSLPSLQERLRVVREQIIATLNECPRGPIQIVSICAGDGRDVIGALLDHPRRNDITAALLDNHSESIARGRAAAEQAGLAQQLRFIEADATRAGNYVGLVPADLVLLSGFLGHLRHEDVPRLIENLPTLCKTGGCVIWNRHLVIHGGAQQVPVIQEQFRKTGFEEVHFETASPGGFVVARGRFTGEVAPLDSSRVLFEFVGLDRLLADSPPHGTALTERAANLTRSAEIHQPPDAGSSWEVEQTICARFEQVAVLHAARTALGSGAWQPTYAELNAAANRSAHVTIAAGGAPGDRVALLLRHDTPLIASILAVLKAGRIVVVLNPSDPPARLKQIVDDAEPGLILTDETNRELAREIAKPTRKVICFEAHFTGLPHNPQIKIAPQDLAFLIYTSGSTGRPKAVMQSHRNILHNARRLSRGMELRAEDRIILLASPSGGQGLATTWCALLNGAVLCPFAPMERSMTELADWMVRHRITVYVSAPSLFRPLVKTLDGRQHFPDVRLVRLGSESATSEDFAAYRKHFTDNCVLFLTLSSSETGNTTQFRMTRNDAVSDGRLPVGFPADGIEVLLLDERGREVANGETGEIAVRGRYLSPGYWRNESLTAERFSRSSSPDDLRVFYSGDLASRDADDLLRFMGRKDTRIKFRGYRVELSEIEDTLVRQPEVERAVVVGRPLPGGDTQLVAYVIPRTGQTCTSETLRRALRTTLPGYMVPAAFVFLEEFPLTPHGKIDRQALPAPEKPRAHARHGAKPRDVIEKTLARIWESVLGIVPIGRRDDFFELGGTSLQSVEVLLHIEERLGALLPPSVLAEHSTIEQLAAVLAGHVVFFSPSPLVPLRAASTGRPLFLVHSGQGDVVTFGKLARRLPDRPVYGLQSVGLQGESWPLMSVPAMARRYLPEIIAKDPTGPYLLGGTCMGGLVAFEVAQMLVRQGRKVGLLALLDVRYPLPAGQHHDPLERFYGPLRDPVRDGFRILRWSIARAAGLGRTARWLPAYRRFVAHMNSRANRSYKPAFYPGALTLFITADTKFPREDLRLLMRRCAKESRVITLPGVRSGLFVRPAVDELARQLHVCLELAEKTP